MKLPTSSQPNQIPEKQRPSLPVAHTAVKIGDTLWEPLAQKVREHELFHMYELFEQNGYFKYKEWGTGLKGTPYVFWESDIFKWLEAVSYSLATHPNPALEALADKAIAYCASLQQPDGYLNIWFTSIAPEKRWTNLRDWHELYCAGHLFEGAVAHFQATGKRSLLDVACRYADYINTVFGVEEGKRRGYSGHEEIELALVKLYHATGEERYLKLSQYFIEERGRQPHYFDIEARERGDDPAKFWAGTYEYNQSHTVVREQHEVVGHAVRAMYLYSALADLARELHDPSLFETCKHLWQHLYSTRLYLTGGLGSSADNEGMTADYDLPNKVAYAETCAAIGLVLWNHRMLQLDVDHRYADVLERALYNGVLSGISLDGSTFFYENPLESQGKHHRQEWFKCPCCPPNVVRLLMSLGKYIYGVNNNEIIVHLYIQNTATIALASQQVVLRQETNYPWDGDIRLHVETPGDFAVNLRIPGWCEQARLTVNGEDVPVEQAKGYVRIERSWQAGDEIRLNLAMPIQRVWAHPNVRDDNGRTALQRGPLVYCLETADNAHPLDQIHVSADTTLESHFDAALLSGVTVIKGAAQVLDSSDWQGELYRTTPPAHRPYEFVAIPYYAWDNREPGEMRVWIHADDMH